jgi:hypothetical protein
MRCNKPIPVKLQIGDGVDASIFRPLNIGHAAINSYKFEGQGRSSLTVNGS